MDQTTLAVTSRAAARWFVVDASKEVLGRMAARIATILQGKHKPIYTPHADVGDYVVVINAREVQVTGRKAEGKVYRHHTGWPGGLIERPFAELRDHHPEEIIRLAVRRMLPKTTMGRHMLGKLKVYAGKEHPHHAQSPEALSFGTLPARLRKE
jgi:large subunit ribosomal protein L13